MIICAAIKVTKQQGEIVICGHRHRNCMDIIDQLGSWWFGAKRIEGFIDHNNNFLDRKEAFEHALACGQISQHNKWYREDNPGPGFDDELFSEDLY